MAHTPPLLDRSLVDDPSADPADLVATIRDLEELKNRAAALQAELAVRLDAATKRRHADLKVPARTRGAGVADEVAIARCESPFWGQVHLGLAKALVAELPATLAAMTDGALSEKQAIAIARGTACLDPDDRALVDRRLCGRRPDGSYPFAGWGHKRLAAEVTRAVAAVDAAALVERRAKAEQDRHVSVRPAEDAMAYLSALLPVEQAVAVAAELKRTSAAATAAGDSRSRGQVEADTLVERVTGLDTAAAVPVEVRLVISDQALTGGSHEPAWLTGPAGTPSQSLTAATARGLVGAASAAGIAALRRIYADPHGRLVAMESTRRCFEAGLAELIDVRDPICRTPWCDAPVRHKDHVTAHAAGGDTALPNGQGLCEHCSYAKEAPGRRTHAVDVDPDGTGLHTVHITTPAGQTVHSTAPPLPIPDRLRMILAEQAESGAPPGRDRQPRPWPTERYANRITIQWALIA